MPPKDTQQLCDKIDDKTVDVRSIGSFELVPASGALVVHLQRIETAELDLELRHKFAQKCAIKEWINTDAWFSEMIAKRK